MEQRRFGSTGKQVPVIGQGTWYIEHGQRAAAVAALRRGLDLGATHIDTAEMYGSGAAEEIVGEAIRGRRQEVFLISKVLPSNASRKGTVAACERSLRHLGTDYLDCYLLHWSGSHPLSETVAGFDELIQAGKIRSWGVSNFDERELAEMAAVAGEGRIACNQVLYHLRERAIEHAVIPWCEQHHVAVVAYSPYGHDDFPEVGNAGRAVLDEIAKAHSVTARQVALGFLLRHPSLFTIPKSSTVKHTEENVGAGRVELSEAEIQKIDKVFPRGSKPRNLPML